MVHRDVPGRAHRNYRLFFFGQGISADRHLDAATGHDLAGLPA